MINEIPLNIVADKIAYYIENPVKFFTEVLDVKEEHVWSKMTEMCEAIRDNRKTAIKAGHSVSKSYTMGRVVLWYLYCFCPCTVITTAPTNTQVEEILWREIHQAHTNAKVKLGGKLTNTELDLSNSVNGKNLKWFAFGFSTRPDTADGNATKMQGFHNVNMLIIFDEGDGIISPIWNAADGLLTNDRAKFIAIGNPMRPNGDFSNCFKDSSFKHITISVKDTPNYIEGREVIPGLSGRQYVEDMAKKWGENSDMFKSRVLGEIPDNDPEAIIPVSWYERAEGRILNDQSGVLKLFLTIDVADGGADDTVVKAWKNKTQIKEWRYPGKRADEIDSDVIRNLREIEGNTIIYDNDGCGRVLGGLLRGITNNIDIIAFEGGNTDCHPDFYNRRAEGYFAMHKDFRDNKISVAKGNERAKEDITSIKWGEPKKGKIIVEPKKELKRRISRSPDDGDAIMMMCACYDMVKPVSKHDIYASRGTKTKSKSWMAA